jgi:hypothetical protein
LTRSVFAEAHHSACSGSYLGFVSSNEFVKVVLRNVLNGWYYQGPSRWSPRQKEALDLAQLSWAVELVFKEHLENVEIVLCYDDPQYNVVLPVDRLQQKTKAADSGLAGEPFVPGQESAEERAKKKPPL